MKNFTEDGRHRRIDRGSDEHPGPRGVCDLAAAQRSRSLTPKVIRASTWPSCGQPAVMPVVSDHLVGLRRVSYLPVTGAL